jgi:hypothetical protein
LRSAETVSIVWLPASSGWMSARPCAAELALKLEVTAHSSAALSL